MKPIIAMATLRSGAAARALRYTTTASSTCEEFWTGDGQRGSPTIRSM